MFALMLGLASWLLPGHLPAPCSQQPADQTPSSTLRPGTTIEQNLSGAAAHTYTITLDQDDFLHLVVEQKGVDVILKILAPDGSPALEQDSPNGTQGPEEVLFLAPASGVYRLVIAPLSQTSFAHGKTGGRYTLRVLTRRPADGHERKQTANLRRAQEATTLATRAGNLIATGAYAEALPLAREALAIREAVYGPEHRFVADALETMALICYHLTDYAQATTLYRRVLAIRDKTLTPEHPDLRRSLNSLGKSLQKQGHFTEAEACYRRALPPGEQLPADTETIRTLTYLADLHQERGQYPAAERFYQRAIAMGTTIPETDSLTLARVFNSLALLQLEQGNLSSAEVNFQQALDIYEKGFEVTPPHVAILLNNLAETLRKRGDDDHAEPLYQRAIATFEARVGGNSPTVADFLSNLAVITLRRKDYTTAETTFRRALAIYDSTLGNQHPLYATCLTNLAETFRLQGRLGEAEALYRQAGAIFEKSLGNAHPALAKTLMNLGWVRGQQKDYAAADQLFHQSLRIQTEAYGPNHPDIIQTLNNLALLAQQQNQPRQALAFQTRANAVREQLLTINLVTGSERQKFLYLKLADEETNHTLTLHLHNLPQDRDAARAALTVLLQRKGRALDAMADVLALLRKQGTPEDLRRLDELTALKGQIAVLTQRGPHRTQSADAHRTELKALQEQADALEADLSRRSIQYRARFAPVTLEAVQNAIPSDAALLEYTVYRPLDPTIEQPRPPRYAVYVLKADGTLHWADLGEAAPIDRAIQQFRRALSTPTRQATAVRRTGARLAAQVIAPIAPALTGIRHLLLSPDSQLNLIPFEALPGRRGQYLLEQFALTYLTSGRDLLALRENREANPNPPVVFAAPDYGSGDQLSLAGSLFPALQPLDGTENEAQTIQRLFPKAIVHTHAAATGEHLLTVERPRFLHLATHGAFLEDGPQPVSTTADDLSRAIGLPQPLNPDQVRRDSPLLRSYLFFAGANQAAPKSTLTALEAAQLNLWGTRLVVLSACQTGVGDVRNGDGVYGLRRAFVLNGAQTQVMSLWSVSDRATQVLMSEFYSRLRRGEPRGEALRQARLQLLRQKHYAHPFYWAGFILTGDWRVM